MICGTASDYAPDCDSPSALGVFDEVWLIKKDNYDKSTIIEATRIISAITLPSGGKEAYKGTVYPGGNSARETMSLSDAGTPQFLDALDTKLPNMGAVSKLTLESFIGELYVAIVRVKTGKPEDQFQVMGDHCGLRCVSATYDSAANGGTIILTLSNNTTPNAEFEPRPTKNFWNTDLPTTIAVLDALLTPTA